MILVTGATGFIGSHLLPKLAASSRVRCLTRPESRRKLPAHPAVESFPMDLSSPEDLGRAMEGVECVIHLAALLRKKSPDEIRRVNVDATQKLVDACQKQGVKRFVFVSTENTLREDIRDAYAETKREAESIVKTFKNSTIFQPCFVYGAGDTHGLGRFVSMARKSPVVPLFGGLQNRIQPVYVEDMVAYLLGAVRKDVRGEFVVAGPEMVSLNDFVLRALKTLGIKKAVVPVPYVFFYLAALFGDALMPKAGWGKTQLKNIYGSRTYSIDKTVKAFGHVPRDIEAGLTAWLGNARRSAQD